MTSPLEAKKNQLRQLANHDFPAAAKAGKYPIFLNHCFLRVVYDDLFQDKWNRHLAKGEAAIHQFTEAQLDRLIATGEAMIASGEVTARLNEASLKYRGKI